MSLSFGISPVFLIPCLLLAGLLAAWVYHKTVPAVSRPKQAALTFLRSSTLFIILFLLFEPILQNLFQTERLPILAVLVDDSQSQTLFGSNTEEDSLQGPLIMEEALNAFSGEEIPGILKFFKFSSQTRPVAIEDRLPIDSLSYQGDRTNLSQALDFVRDDLKDENLKGVLLLSDGQYNTGRNPIYLAERYPMPIYTVVVGDTARKRDLQIRRVTTNEIAYVDDELPIRVGLLSEDFAGERVTVSLIENGVQLQSAPVVLTPGITESQVELLHTPSVAGLHRYTVRVTQLPGEATIKNNSYSFAVRVLENKKRVLLLASAPEPDVSALQQVLNLDKNLQVDAYIQKNQGTFYNEQPLDSLDTYDAIILMGYPGNAANTDVARQVAGAIEDGVPALFVLSRQTNLRLYRDIFGPVLPVQPRTLRTNFVESAFTPTPAGLQHPIFQIQDFSPAIWNLFPPLVFNDNRWQASPDARILASHTIRGISLDDPMLVVQNRNRHRTAALLGAGTWRWKNLPEDLEPAGPAWVNIFSNTLQWITTREDDRPVRVQPVDDLFSGNASIQFTGQVYDESLNPVDGASIEVNVIASDSIQYPYTMEPIGNGQYVLDIGALPEGTYQYISRATANGTLLGEDEGNFAVGSLTVEFNETQADGVLMRTLAQRSGGEFFTIQNISQLSSHLEQSESFSSVFFEERIDTELWQRYFFLVVIILLLTLEWFVRKRSGMV